MLTVQACQQHQLGAMNPTKAKSFPAATVPAVAKLGHRRRGKRGTRSKERRNARRAHTSKRQCRRWKNRGVVELPHPTHWKKEGKNLGRKHLEELSERRTEFARKKRRGKRAERKSVRKKYKFTRARSRLVELTFGTFNVRIVNVRIAAVNGVNGIGHINTLLRTCATKGCDVIELQETKRDGTSEISASGYRIFFSGDCRMVKGRKGQHGVGLAIKENIVKKTGEDGITTKCTRARLLKARIPIKPNFVTFRGSLCPDRGSAGGAEGQIHGSPELHRSISARSGVRLRFNRRKRQDTEEVRAEEKQTARCWAHMAETSSTKRQTTAGFRRRQQARSSEHFLLHPQKWRFPYVPECQPQQGTSTFGLYSDKAGEPPTHPLR